MLSGEKMGDFESAAKLFKALMHPARLEILDILRNGEHCVCHLEAALGYRQAYISQQLMVLREAGLVQDRRDGWNSYYRIIQPQVFALLDVAQTMSGVNPAKVRQQLSAKLSSCSCPRCTPEPVTA
jgi:DNA-binding transcriptional ArsR family regulator